jgi:hypothetical protein
MAWIGGEDQWGGRRFWGAKHWGVDCRETATSETSQPGFQGHNRVDLHRNRDNFHGGYNNGSSDIITFCFNNIPEGISHVQLRAEFGQCGALVDVFLARRRNARGRRFGFVRFSKVRDKEKMVRALNQVWFDTFKVCANIAAFNRSTEKQKDGGVRVETSEKVTEKGKGVVVGEGNKEGNNEGMRMKETFVAVVENGRRLVTKGVNNIVTDVEKPLENKEWCVRWSSKGEDRRWASNGVVCVVRNGVDLSSFSESIGMPDLSHCLRRIWVEGSSLSMVVKVWMCCTLLERRNNFLINS